MGLDLQSGRSHWLLENRHLPEYPELDHHQRADVVVIGAGISGALAAAVMVDAGLRVIVLDRRALACGSTGASTALLSYEPDQPMVRIAERHGWDVAVRVYGAARDANVQLADLIRRLHVDCDYQAARSFHLARTPDQSTALYEEHRLRRRAGLECESLSAAELRRQFGLMADSALLTREAGELDPVRLTVGLLKHVVENGSSCYRAHVTRIDPDGKDHAAVTDRGHRVTGRRIVFATGYETQLMLQQNNVQLTSTYAIATDVVPDLPAWLHAAILWDLDEPYHYARCARGRVLVGGGDEPFVDEAARDSLMPQKAAALLDYLRTILPGTPAQLATTWCGTFARTDDSLPYIGERRDMPGAFFSLGYGGNGITAAMLGARCACDVVLGRRNPALALFSFERDLAHR